jgi:hypothetical protein
MRILNLLLSLLLATAAFADSADLGTEVFTIDRLVDPGQAVVFHVIVCNETSGGVVPTNVVIDLAPTLGLIEKVEGSPGLGCGNEGEQARCTAAAFTNTCERIDVTVRTLNGRVGGTIRLIANVKSDTPDPSLANNRAEASAQVYRWLTVANTFDAGPGSLRDAILTANANCTPGPCRIVFEIPPPVPAEGWFTIMPVEPLPLVTADRVTIEGSRQTAFTGDTNPLGPEIAIDGRLIGFGLQVQSRCESVVEGLAIGNFRHTPALTWSSTGAGCAGQPNARYVFRNYLGTDPTGLVPWPNLRGINTDANGAIYENRISNNIRSGIWAWSGSLYLRQNRITDNGASGIFLGPAVRAAQVRLNVIANHPEMGVAIARGARGVDLMENAIRANGGLGIDWGLDGVSPVDSDDPAGPSNAPVLLAARYDAATDQTLVTLTVHRAPGESSANGGVVQFYENAAPDGDGEHWVGQAFSPEANTTTTVTFRGDYRGKWLNATWTRDRTVDPDFLPSPTANTSELSNAILVAP